MHTEHANRVNPLNTRAWLIATASSLAVRICGASLLAILLGLELRPLSATVAQTNEDAWAIHAGSVVRLTLDNGESLADYWEICAAARHTELASPNTGLVPTTLQLLPAQGWPIQALLFLTMDFDIELNGRNSKVRLQTAPLWPILAVVLCASSYLLLPIKRPTQHLKAASNVSTRSPDAVAETA